MIKNKNNDETCQKDPPCLYSSNDNAMAAQIAATIIVLAPSLRILFRSFEYLVRCYKVQMNGTGSSGSDWRKHSVWAMFTDVFAVCDCTSIIS